MQAVILAAGKSSRFSPFTSFGHKSMVSLLGKPLLQHTLESLQKAKCSKVVIVIGKNSSIPKHIHAVKGLDISYIVQDTALGMGHALLQAQEYLEDTFFLLSGYHVDVADFADKMLTKQKKDNDVILLAQEDSRLERYGVLQVSGDTVEAVEEKPETTGKGQRIIGIYLLNKAFLSVLHSLPVEQYHFEKALDAYAKNGNVRYVQATSPTITLKHSWDILTVKDYLLSKIKRYVASKAHIAKSVIIEGDVFVSDDVTILEGATIKGPCFLGKGVMVGNNTILRNGVVAENQVVIGATMEVKNSLLMTGVTTHTGFIGDSIIGSNARLAAGFCTANVRFDRGFIKATVNGKETNTYRTHIGAILGENVDAGINVSTMPGITIGNNVTLGPSTVVLKNVEDNVLMYTKFQTVIKKK